MTLTIPSYKKPVEEVARAIWRGREMRTEPRLRRPEPDAMDMVTGAFALVCADAVSAITRLRELGFINDIGLAAIHAEEDSNGQPRSSVVPGKDETIRAEEAGK